ncbi:helix-turn-helix transcriptional regulator [Sorangium cellulosum]|uniref:helix-turn-helix transcriptional regulator n=1 Tax=Sorangium cellulosum TaxID=56 RepID=UPI000A9341FE|nr:helix-turn-helix transcriptional regulator [Sorangium cellulosum]
MIPRRTHGSVLLARSGLRQEDIARKCGVARSTVGHWMTGHATPRAVTHLLILRDSYGIPIDAWAQAPEQTIAN